MSRKAITRFTAVAVAATAITAAACSTTAGRTVPPRCDRSEDACAAVYSGHGWRFVPGARGEAIARAIARHRLPAWLSVQSVPLGVRAELHIGSAMPAVELVGSKTTFVVTSDGRVFTS